MSNHSSSLIRRLIWYILVGIALYWIGNVLAVFPWLLSKTFGIIVMFLSTILWMYLSFYCLKHVPRKAWNRDTIFIAMIFLITAIIQDYVLYVVYRGIPDELYEPTTFLAYGFVLLIPFFVRYVLLRKYRLKSILLISNTKFVVTIIIGVISCAITLWSVRFW
jgi:hypothetical protein